MLSPIILYYFSILIVSLVNLHMAVQDIQMKQNVTAECIIKKLNKDRGYEFQKKGNKHQFISNDEIKDQIDTTSSLVSHVKSVGFSNPSESG